MADLPTVTISTSTFPNVLALPVSSNIGGIDIDVSIEEVHSDTLEVTEHPVEAGAAITDHSFKKPSEVVLRCGWSNSSLGALTAIVSGLVSGGTQSAHDYVTGIYSQLRKLQESRQPFSITTSLWTYDNMLLTSIQVTRDQKTFQALIVTATCREVILVSTQSTTMPPQDNQATPASTAEVQNTGSASAVTATPAPGGSNPPSNW